MKRKMVSRLLLMLVGIGPLLLFSACCHMNKLQGHQFKERTVAALMPYPAPAEIFTDHWEDVDFNKPVEAIIGIGTGIAKEVEVSKTRAKLDSAMHMVDIPELIRQETLSRGAELLNYTPVKDTRSADYLFNIEIQHYGIDAKSWSAGVYFTIEAKVTLQDNQKNKEIWRSCFDEKTAISQQIFGLPSAAGNIITAMALSQLTTQQIAKGLKNLSLYTADRIVQKLQKDFLKKR